MLENQLVIEKKSNREKILELIKAYYEKVRYSLLRAKLMI